MDQVRVQFVYGGEIRDRRSYKDDVFFQRAKEKLRENQVKERSTQLVTLAEEALKAKHNKMARILMQVKLAFDKGEHGAELSNEIIDDLFKKASESDPKIGDGCSPRTQEVLNKIDLSKKARGASLEQLF